MPHVLAQPQTPPDKLLSLSVCLLPLGLQKDHYGSKHMYKSKCASCWYYFIARKMLAGAPGTKLHHWALDKPQQRAGLVAAASAGYHGRRCKFGNHPDSSQQMPLLRIRPQGRLHVHFARLGFNTAHAESNLLCAEVAVPSSRLPRSNQ